MKLRIKNPGYKLGFTAAYLLLIAALQHFGITCVYKALFGVICPGCGMTRALLAALRLDFSGAFAYHSMFWAVPVMYLYFLFDGRLFKKKWADAAVWIVIGAGFLANWVLRLLSNV